MRQQNTAEGRGCATAHPLYLSVHDDIETHVLKDVTDLG